MFSILLLIFSCFLFSVLAAMIKFCSQFIHPFEQAFFRNFISIIIILPFIFTVKKIVNKKSNIKFLFLRAIFGGVTMILLFWSYTLIPISHAMAISFSTPLFIYVGGIFIFKEKTSIFNKLMISLGFILTVILLRPDLEIKLGVVLALVAAITHAVTALLVKKLSESESILALMFSMVLLMTPITLVPAAQVWVNPQNSQVFVLLLLIALIATAGNFCWTKALSDSKLTNLMPFDFSKLIFTIILGFFLFDEKIDLITLICGAGLIICANLTALDIKKNEKNKTVLPNN